MSCGAYEASERLLDVEGQVVGDSWRPGGEPLALVVRMRLAPGQYATTALREVALLRADESGGRVGRVARRRGALDSEALQEWRWTWSSGGHQRPIGPRAYGKHIASRSSGRLYHRGEATSWCRW